MRRNIRVHRAHHAQVVHQFAQLRKDFADFNAGLAPGRKLEGGTHGHPVHAWNRLAVQLGQRRFGVPRIHVRGGALGENMDDPFGLGGKRRGFGQERGLRFPGPGRRRQQVIPKERGQTQSAKPHARPLQKLPPGQKPVLQPREMLRFIFVVLIHNVILIHMTHFANLRFRFR